MKKEDLKKMTVGDGFKFAMGYYLAQLVTSLTFVAIGAVVVFALVLCSGK